MLPADGLELLSVNLAARLGTPRLQKPGYKVINQIKVDRFLIVCVYDRNSSITPTTLAQVYKNITNSITLRTKPICSAA